MPWGGARGQNLEHLRIFFLLFFSCMELFIFEQQVLFRVDSVTSNLKVKVPWGRARGQNLGHLRIVLFFCFYFSSMNHLYLNKRYYLGLNFSL